MRHTAGRLLVLGLALALAPGGGQGAAPPARPSPVEAAVRRVLREQVIAWNKGDLEGFMKGYWKSGELTFFSGKERTQGWRGTLQRYRKRYQSKGAEMGRLRFAEVEVILLGGGHALVRGRWQLERKKDRPGGLFTLLMQRRAEGWRIVHDHTSG
jgi:beta-aspartyl-peptidase (threonine type)